MKRPPITPGDWSDTGCDRIRSGAGVSICAIPRKLKEDCSDYVASVEVNANGKVIASVPKLLAALECALSTLGKCESDMQCKVGLTEFGNPKESDFPLAECYNAVAEIKSALIEAGYKFDEQETTNCEEK